MVKLSARYGCANWSLDPTQLLNPDLNFISFSKVKKQFNISKGGRNPQDPFVNPEDYTCVVEICYRYRVSMNVL